jgi:hypothetical protein
MKTNSLGIFQSDIILRTAIQSGIDDIRKKPWLLDYVFASLSNDDLTKDFYGAKEMALAKKWFVSSELHVFMGYQISEAPKTPAIAINIIDSSEAERTLGDIDESVSELVVPEDIIITPETILGPFTPLSYDPLTGVVTLPPGLTTGNIYPGALLYDVTKNVGYIISEIASTTEFIIPAGLSLEQANFTKAYIAPPDNFWLAKIESLRERESYRVDLYNAGDYQGLMYLYCVVKFVLLRYKQSLLEARGFEQTSITTTGLTLASESHSENTYTRGFVVSGYVRQYWPKDITPRIQNVRFQDAVGNTGIKIKDGPKSPSDIDLTTAAWEMAGDGIG